LNCSARQEDKTLLWGHHRMALGASSFCLSGFPPQAHPPRVQKIPGRGTPVARAQMDTA